MRNLNFFGVFLGYKVWGIDLKKPYFKGFFCYLAETVGFEPTGRF